MYSLDSRRFSLRFFLSLVTLSRSVHLVLKSILKNALTLFGLGGGGWGGGG